MAERPTATTEHILRPNVESVLRGLFKHAESRLSESELQQVSFLREEAESMLGHVASLAQNIGCLVAADGDHALSSDMAGNYRSTEDVAQLLWTISEQINVAKAMLNVSEWADEAIERRATKATPSHGKGAARG